MNFPIQQIDIISTNVSSVAIEVMLWNMERTISFKATTYVQKVSGLVTIYFNLWLIYVQHKLIPLI